MPLPACQLYPFRLASASQVLTYSITRLHATRAVAAPAFTRDALRTISGLEEALSLRAGE